MPRSRLEDGLDLHISAGCIRRRAWCSVDQRIDVDTWAVDLRRADGPDIVGVAWAKLQVVARRGEMEVVIGAANIEAGKGVSLGRAVWRDNLAVQSEVIRVRTERGGDFAGGCAEIWEY